MSLAGGCCQHRRLTVTAVIRCICTPPSSLWDKLNTAKSSNAVSALSATHDAASRQIMHQQLAPYLAEQTLSHSQNPLSWWATNRQKYPSVAAVAIRLLARQLQASVRFPRPGM